MKLQKVGDGGNKVSLVAQTRKAHTHNRGISKRTKQMDGPQRQTQTQQCQFWLPKKKRFCANSPSIGSEFCGNHKPAASRIPCPIDPSHTILEVDVVSHIKKCPLVKQIEALKLKPYYEKGINSGSEEEEDLSFRNLSCIHGKCTLPKEVEGFQACKQENATFEDNNSSPDMKRKAVFAMTGHEFCALIEKIESAHSAICQSNIQNSYLQPDACGKWLNAGLDRRLPFQEKHVIQQASMLGNLEIMGVIRSPEPISEIIRHSETKVESAYGEEREMAGSQLKVVEFGAGRGYLTHMISDCYGIKDIVLVERRSYKFKADRTLRQAEGVNLERLRIDIEDLNLEAVESLKGSHYAAVGKHLCGPATDLVLRCCLLGHICNKNVSEDMDTKGRHPHIKGLAIATCCHHLCQWKSYVNKCFFLNLGFTREEFWAATWLTSWALDGEHCSEHSDAVNRGADLQDCDTCEVPCNGYEVGDIIRCLKASGRAMLGMKCKEILDTGRLMWLREQGLNAKLVNYVPVRVSPENRLLLARIDENN